MSPFSFLFFYCAVQREGDGSVAFFLFFLLRYSTAKKAIALLPSPSSCFFLLHFVAAVL